MNRVEDVAHDVIQAAFEVHKILGPGLLESVYEEALCKELELRGMRYERQKGITVNYKGLLKFRINPNVNFKIY